MARRESTEPLSPLPAIKTVPGVGRGDPGQVKTLESYLKQVEKCVELVQKKHSKKFNKEQCDYLAGKLQVVVESASLFLNGQCRKHQASCSCADMGRSVQIFELLLALAKQIESFVEGCCNEAWIQAAMKLTNTSEYVASLGFNLELCRVAFSNGSGAAENLTFSQVEVEGINKAVVDIVEQKALVDMDAVLAKLTSELRALRGNKRAGLAAYAYLYQRLLRIRGDPDSFTSGPSSSGATDEGYLQKFCHLLKGKKPSEMKLGKGGFATVYKVNWQGTQVAKKTFFGKEDPSFLQEVKILEGLCHPNIMSMYGFEMVTNSCSIFMELMDGDLYEFMQERLGKNSDSSPFNILEAVDIMLQAGEGVNYLHNKQIVHRDLKAANILVKNVKATLSKIGYVLVKVADFGLSKIKESTTSNLTFNTGTSRWMAPEIIDLVPGSHESPSVSEKRKKHPFKCDVYSFGMVCCEILTGDIPFGNEILPSQVRDKVKQGVRPTLPSNCPSILRALIEKCWDKVPEQRPSLDIICLELKYLKYLLITGGTEDMPVQLSWSTIGANEEAQQAYIEEETLQNLATVTTVEALQASAIVRNEEPQQGAIEMQLRSSTIVTSGLTMMQAPSAQYEHVTESTSGTSSVTSHYSDASSLGTSDVQTLLSVTELIKVVMQCTQAAVKCKAECRKLHEELDVIKPDVERIEKRLASLRKANYSDAHDDLQMVEAWLTRLKSAIEAAKVDVYRCNSGRFSLDKHKLSVRLTSQYNTITNLGNQRVQLFLQLGSRMQSRAQVSSQVPSQVPSHGTQHPPQNWFENPGDSVLRHETPRRDVFLQGEEQGEADRQLLRRHTMAGMASAFGHEPVPTNWKY